MRRVTTPASSLLSSSESGLASGGWVMRLPSYWEVDRLGPEGVGFNDHRLSSRSMRFSPRTPTGSRLGLTAPADPYGY